jgi:hypothetical protein
MVNPTGEPGSWCRAGPGSGAIQWLVPPDGSGVLYSAGPLELAIHEAAAVLARQLVG